MTPGWASPPTTRTGRRGGSRPRPCACRWWPRWTTGRSAPPTGFGGIGSCGSLAGPTRTPGATGSATRPPGGTSRPWPSWPGRHPSPSSRRPCCWRWGNGYTSPAGTGSGSCGASQDQYPDDFWVNFTVARALYGAFRQGKGDWAAATPYYQKALDLRPKAVAVHNNLGLVLVDVGWLEDNADGRWGPGAITTFRRALRIDPNFARPATTSACA